MECVILVAGKGTRLKPLTDTLPKTLLDVHGQPILAHLLDRLPEKIDRVHLVTGYLGQKIRAFIEKYPTGGRNITTVQSHQLTGSAASFWSVKDHLSSLPDDPFLVLFGDDLYTEEDLSIITNIGFAIGVQTRMNDDERVLTATTDKEGIFHGFVRVYGEQPKQIATGAFVINRRIFDYPQVQIRTGEYGLPQTIAAFAEQRPIPMQVVELPGWRQINTIEDLERVNRLEPV